MRFFMLLLLLLLIALFCLVFCWCFFLILMMDSIVFVKGVRRLISRYMLPGDGSDCLSELEFVRYPQIFGTRMSKCRAKPPTYTLEKLFAKIGSQYTEWHKTPPE
jgi:hypothetical protein